MNYHDVLGFKISVSDSQRMEISNPSNHLGDDIGRLGFIQKFKLPDHLEKIFSFHQFCYDIDMGLCLNAFFKMHKQGMRED